MNDIILKLFDYASQGLPCLLDNLEPLLGCSNVSLLEQQSGLEAANDVIQVTSRNRHQTSFSDNTSYNNTSSNNTANIPPMLDICADNPCVLMLQIDSSLSNDICEPSLLVCHYDSSHSAQTALLSADLQELVPHIRQALLIAREISEQIGDIQALQYVIQHHPLKDLFNNRLPAPLFISGTQQNTVQAANQTFELAISKQRLSQHFKLSPSEVELAQALFSGLSLNEITEERHVSKQTVRKQLQSILKKSGAQSQEALILMMFDSCLLNGLDSYEQPPAPDTSKLDPGSSR